MNMTRKQAITALLAALPGAAMAANRPIEWATVKEYVPPRYACIFKPDGSWEIPLDGWTCIRVTLGDESVEVTPAELFEALKPPDLTLPLGTPTWTTMEAKP